MRFCRLTGILYTRATNLTSARSSANSSRAEAYGWGLATDWRCQFANDICAKKAASYRAVFRRLPNWWVCDVATLTTAELPGPPDLVWASFPCQDLSLAGAGRGYRVAERSIQTLLESYGLDADGRAAKLVVIENVTGVDFTSGEGFCLSDSGIGGRR